MPADAAAPPVRPHAPESVADASPVPVAQLPSTPRHGRRIAFPIAPLLLAALAAAFAWPRRPAQAPEPRTPTPAGQRPTRVLPKRVEVPGAVAWTRLGTDGKRSAPTSFCVK